MDEGCLPFLIFGVSIVSLEDGLAIFRDSCDVGVCIADGHVDHSLIRRYLCKDVDAAADFTQLHLHQSRIHQRVSLLVMVWFHPFQTLQPFAGIGSHIAEGGGMFISHLMAVGDAAGESVLVHATIQHQANALQCSCYVSLRCGNSKSNGSWLRDSEGGAHVVMDQLGKSFHFCLCLMKQVIRLHTSNAHG